MARTNAELKGKRCKCPSCSEVFTTTANFDRHRKGKHGIDRHCVNPEQVGLEIKTLPSGYAWGMPGIAITE